MDCTITPSMLKDLLKQAYRNGRKVLVVGPPGCGKSEIMEQAANEIGFRFIARHPAIEDPTDVKGFPMMTSDINGNPRAMFLPYGDMAEMCETENETVVAFDDLGQSTNSMQAALMQVFQARQLNGRRISDKVRFVAATNDATHRAGVNGLIEPVKSRFDCILNFKLDMDDWCDWAIGAGMPIELISYVRTHPDALYDWKPTKELVNQSCPRTLASLGKWLNDGVRNLQVYCGCVGVVRGTEFYKFLDGMNNIPSPDDIMLDPDGAPVPDKPSHLYALSASIARFSNQKNFDRLMKYLDRLNQQFRVLTIKQAMKIDAKIKETRGFIAWATKNELAV